MNKLIPQSSVTSTNGYQPVNVPQREYMSSSGGGAKNDTTYELGDLGVDPFFESVHSIRDAIRELEADVQSLATKQAYSLSNPSGHVSNSIDGLTLAITTNAQKLRTRIHTLGTQVGKDETKRQHWDTLKGSLLRATQKFNDNEKKARDSVKDRIIRQYKIVKPDATDDEVKQVVAGGNAQVFQMAMVSARTSDARAALSDAQSRRTDILKLEATLVTLAELTQQVADLVIVQDSQFISIEEAAAGAETDLKQSSQQMALARASAAAARHKRKICLGVVLVIVTVIVVVVTVQFSGAGSGGSDSKRDSSDVASPNIAATETPPARHVK